MSAERLDTLGPLYDAIGKEIASTVDGEPDGTFAYLEAGDGWVGGAVFKDEGAQVRYYDFTDRLFDLVLDAWESEPKDKRWAAMKFAIVGTRFSAAFQYPEELPSKSTQGSRTDTAVATRFGGKPVIYPPIPEGLMKA